MSIKNKINKLFGGSEEEVPDFAALLIDGGRNQFKLETLPMDLERFWINENMGVTRVPEAAEEGSVECKVDISKLHEVDGGIPGVDADYLGVWDLGNGQEEPWTWEKPSCEFPGKNIYIAGRETTTLDSIKAAFKNLGLGMGTELGSFLYIIIIVAIIVIGGYFVLLKTGLLESIMGGL